MNNKRLPERLLKIASLVPRNSVAADVGTDHCRLPVYLITSGICRHVYATEIKHGPYKRAEESISQAKLSDRITLFLCDGLEKCPVDSTDTVIIAGMGGETVSGIISRAPRTASKRLLILQPMTKSERLRQWLCENEYTIITEYLTEDAGKIYPVILATGGKVRTDYSAAELAAGKFEFFSAEPLAKKHIDLLIKKYSKEITGIKSAGIIEIEKEKNLRKSTEILYDLTEMRRDICADCRGDSGLF
ncbi:MAG: class I SAM-dependent methyltransferase [Oscillospiraceae bacterium]|nr:class I SAM-dependent methyltransferase [Oscillospiraceae bacterium]